MIRLNVVILSQATPCQIICLRNFSFTRSFGNCSNAKEQRNASGRKMCSGTSGPRNIADVTLESMDKKDLKEGGHT